INDPSPEVAFAGTDGNIRLMNSALEVTQVPGGTAPIAGGTTPAIAVDVNGTSGHWQIAWQGAGGHTPWTFRTGPFGQHNDDRGDVMGGETSPALSNGVSLSQVVCCVGGGGGVGGGGVGGG